MEGDALVRVAAEPAEYHRTLVDVRPFYAVGGEQDDGGVPLRTVQAEVLAPFPKGGIVDDVGSPHVAVYRPRDFFAVRVGTGKGAVPSCGIEIAEIHRFAVNGDFPRLVSVESVRRSYVGRDCPVRIHRAPRKGHPGPVLQITGFGCGHV